jgi:hypothetical protein
MFFIKKKNGQLTITGREKKIITNTKPLLDPHQLGPNPSVNP